MSKPELEAGSPDEAGPDQREDWIRKDITSRLSRICEDLSAEKFEDLIGSMTREQLRGERSR